MTFDPQALILKARKGPLSVGETHALSVHVAGLEKALLNHRDAQIAQCRREDCIVALGDGALLITFPGEPPHTVSVPLGQPSLAIDFLISTLRKRRGEVNRIATAGAPTKAEVDAILRAGKKPRKVGVVANLTLEDLGL